MPITINGTTGISGVDGSASTPALAGSDADTGLTFAAGLVGAGVNGSAARVRTAFVYRLNSTLAGANVTTAQSLLGAGVTLEGSTVYAFEAACGLTKSAGATSHNFGLGFGGTATLNNIGYHVNGQLNATSLTTTTSSLGNLFPFFIQSASATTICSPASATTAIIIYMRGTVSVNAGGTFIPQYTLSAAPGGAYTTAAASFFEIWPLGASGLDTSIGPWS